MSVIGAILVPHPPLIIPAVGKGQEREISATVAAYREAARAVAAWGAEAVVVASPHATMYADYFHISPGPAAQGDMAAFRAPGEKLAVLYDGELRDEIVRRAAERELAAGPLGEKAPMLDHGSFIPLWFLREAGVSCPVVRLGLSGLSPLDHYRLGQCVAEAAEALGRRVVFVASGDLSHKLAAEGPYGYAPQGPVFDRLVTESMARGDFSDFLTIAPALQEGAAECGLRAFQIMAGALDGRAVTPRLLSYEGPFGVGYAVATFAEAGSDEGRRFADLLEAAELQRIAARRAAEDPWVRLARLSLETFVRTGKPLEQLPDDLPEALLGQEAGVFVSLSLHGALRGCIGIIAPTTPSLAKEIVRNAVSAGTADPRFSPVTQKELPFLEYKVDVLGEAEPIDSPALLDVKRYGVIVTAGRRRGLLLPDLEGVETVEQQVSIACRKAGIGRREDFRLERFPVVRHL